VMAMGEKKLIKRVFSRKVELIKPVELINVLTLTSCMRVKNSV
jgi:hypothetical protein